MIESGVQALDGRRVQPSGDTVQGAVAFLRSLTAGEPAALAAWLSAHRLDKPAVRWLDAQGLAAYTFYRLRAAGLLAGLPAEVQAALRGSYYRTAGDTELLLRELTQVLQALAARGVTPILFKGAVLAHIAYPDPACRPMGDLDLWVTAAEMPRARTALEDLGYAQHTKAERPIAFQEQRSGELQLVGQRPGSGLVELHWGVFAGEWLNRTAAVDEAAVRGRATPVAPFGPLARALAPEDAVIQLAAHLAVNHQFAYPWVRGLVDVALLIRAQAVDWGVIAERARAWRLGVATWLVLHLTAEMLGLDEAAPALERLKPASLRRRLLGYMVDPSSLLAMRDLTRGPQRFLLQLLLVDRRRDAVRLVWQALWPEDRWLMDRYGSATASVRWRHLRSALRGRV